MPELPSFPKANKSIDFTVAELQSVYLVLRNHVRVNESTTYKPGSNEAFRMLRIRSVVRKIEAFLDAQADNQLRSDAESTED